jgi:hypothetical protein
VSEQAREDEKSFVLSAREALSLLGEEPSDDSEAPEAESVEPASDVVGDPERRR